MKRHDYVLLANALRSVRPSDAELVGQAQHSIDCFAIARAIKKKHTGFEAQQFMKDCGITASLVSRVKEEVPW